MINYLRIKNFRHHEDVELHFGSSDQLILIAGPNGSGKTSLLEAVLLGLTGETRHGRKGLDGVVRRGAELEGFEIILEFAVADTTYRVHRRRAEKTSTAVLYANGAPIAETPRAVDAEIQRIIGMDAAGFKLAVFAKQKELDGLTSMDRSARRRVISRLLRVEQLGKASARANDQYLRQSEIVRALGPAPDMNALDAEVTGATTAAASADAQVAAADAHIAELDEMIAATVDVEAAWTDANATRARAEGALDAARASLARLQASPPPEPGPEPENPTAQIGPMMDELRAAEIALTEGRSAAEIAASRAATQSDLDDLDDQIAQLDNPSERVAELTAATDALASEIADTAARGTAVRGEQRTLADTQVRVETELSAAQARRIAFDAVGGTCDHCGQPVPAEHRDAHIAELDETIAALIADRDNAAAATTAAATSIDALLAEHSALTARDRALRAELAAATHAAQSVAELERRRSVYVQRLARPAPPEVNLTELEATATRLAGELDTLRAKVATHDAWRPQAEAAARFAGDVADAKMAISTATGELDKAAVPEDLRAAFDRRRETIEIRAAELELRSALRETAVEAAATLTAARERLAVAAERAERHAERSAKARIAAYAKTVLADVHSRLSAQLRPNLEGALCDLVAALSQGRFPSAKIDDDYEITVLDGDTYRPLAELSGGEQDLVALALRLALSSVVADRYGSDALGLLILDEVVGSLDGERREAVLTTLRERRSTYGQIFMISHVPNMEEAADKVVELFPSADRTSTEVLAS